MRIDAHSLAGMRAEAATDGGPGAAQDAPLRGVDWLRTRLSWYTVLLRQTLEHAERSVPFYRQRAVSGPLRAEEFKTISDLQRLPLVTKLDVVREADSFLSEAVRPDCFHCTSGTTARRVIVYGHTDEFRAQAALLELRASVATDEPRVSLRVYPNVLRVGAPPSRTHSSVHSVVMNFSLAQTHHQWFDNCDHLIEILGQEYRLGDRQPRRISVLHFTPPYFVEFVTSQVTSRGIDPRAFGVQHIATSGGFTSRRVRQLIADRWGAESHSTYSCTEINGEASARTDSSGDYLPGPTMFCEILDPHSGVPVDDWETGNVVLTSLDPFQVAMPFIRYNTGDLAQRVPIPGLEGQSIFYIRPLGRQVHCVPVGARAWVGTRDVIEAVSGFEAVPQFPYPRHRLVVDRNDRDATVTLVVEVVAPWSPTNRTIEDEIAGALQAECVMRLGPTRCPPVRVRCRAVGKGELPDYARLYPDR
jgi:phenylacetate-coenzyme A ligase PaaK-like adenylate-forming protein